MNFDIGMGAYHGAQACELVGLFLLSKLKDIPDFRNILYRDDGLGVTTLTAQEQEQLSQKIRGIFAEQDLKIVIEINLSRVDFLDITMDLETGTFKPFRKAGDRPLYVSAHSNHPPQILKNIPTGIEQRLSDNSANEAIFNEAIPIYQTELDRCGYKHVLKYNPRSARQRRDGKKGRSRNITWFNPPFSMEVATNVAREFLKLIETYFPPGNILHSVINRSTVKVSYRCLPNMGAQVAKHNSKVLRGPKNRDPPLATARKAR